jgi:hypothetical protein
VENRNIQLRQAVNSPPLIVREYAHRVEPNRPVRDDFTETVLWQPVLIIPQQGVADVRFDLSDHVGRYEVLVAAHTLDGRLGALQHEIEARKPFSLDPRLPQEIGSTDRVEVPLTLVNDTAIERSVQLVASPTGVGLQQGQPAASTAVGPATAGPRDLLAGCRPRGCWGRSAYASTRSASRLPPTRSSGG